MLDTENKNTGKGGQRIRHRMRGMLSTKTGKAVGITSLLMPVAGFIVQDLKKPDSLTRALVSKALEKLRKSKDKLLDISDKVEVSTLQENKNDIDIERRKEN